MPKLTLKRMGVMNITPDSFSDGGELSSPDQLQRRLREFSFCDAIDIGAESTAPMNQALPWEVEWDRLQTVLPHIKDFPGALSFDTYHPETMESILRFYQDHSFKQTLIWNDVSGKFDGFVRDFLSFAEHFHYVYCHNLAPERELTGKHMDYVRSDLDLVSYFVGKKRRQVIFDPCLGFSKSSEQNWWILEHLAELLPLHDRWLIGFSRKSFLRKKYGLTLEQREDLDRVHTEELGRILPILTGEVWIRTHRPELILPA